MHREHLYSTRKWGTKLLPGVQGYRRCRNSKETLDLAGGPHTLPVPLERPIVSEIGWQLMVDTSYSTHARPRKGYY
jgi:hypothetical protein